MSPRYNVGDMVEVSLIGVSMKDGSLLRGWKVEEDLGDGNLTVSRDGFYLRSHPKNPEIVIIGLDNEREAGVEHE